MQRIYLYGKVLYMPCTRSEAEEFLLKHNMYGVVSDAGPALSACKGSVNIRVSLDGRIFVDNRELDNDEVMEFLFTAYDYMLRYYKIVFDDGSIEYVQGTKLQMQEFMKTVRGEVEVSTKEAFQEAEKISVRRL